MLNILIVNIMKIDELTPTLVRMNMNELADLGREIKRLIAFREHVREASDYEEGDMVLWMEECVPDEVPYNVAEAIWNEAHSEGIDYLLQDWYSA